MLCSCNTIQTQTTVGLPLSDDIVSQGTYQHPSLYIRTVKGQMYCILTKYTVVGQMLKFGGGHIFLGGFTGGDKKIRLIRIIGGGWDVYALDSAAAAGLGPC